MKVKFGQVQEYAKSIAGGMFPPILINQENILLDGWHRWMAAKAASLPIAESNEWSGPAFQTCMDVASICAKFETSRRRDVVGFNHHREVASLPIAECDQLLDWCEDECHKTGRVPTRVVLREKVKQVKAYGVRNFKQSNYLDSQGKTRQAFKMTEGGFAVVARGGERQSRG